ncbi:hypothetical protein [Daejeonella sp.]|uniref:hypothetical protein n=1 Tax=Daejeonella sp. TaxID=2805397 RepID=UPI002D1FB107|nr:hypothetical protein [Daejeonella sp.]
MRNNGVSPFEIFFLGKLNVKIKGLSIKPIFAEAAPTVDMTATKVIISSVIKLFASKATETCPEVTTYNRSCK